MEILWIIIGTIAILGLLSWLFKKRKKALFAVEIPTPLIASDKNSGTIKIIPLNSTRDSNEPPQTYIQNDHGDVYLLDLQKNGLHYETQMAIQIAREYVLHIEHKGAIEYHQIEVSPSTPFEIITANHPFEKFNPSKGMLVTAFAVDQYDNAIPSDQMNFTFSSEEGHFSPPDEGKYEVARIFDHTIPMASMVKVEEKDNHLQAIIDVLLPEVAMRGPVTAIIEDGKKTLFPVHIYLRLEENEKLRDFELKLKMNELTGFDHFKVDTQINLPSEPEINIVDKQITITSSYIDPAMIPEDPYIYIGEYWFECLGEGESLIEVEDVTYTVSNSPDRKRRGKPDRWERQACLNKRRIKKLCINPIVFGNSWRKSEILRELQITQDNFDEACCKITIEVNGIAIQNLTIGNLRTQRINGVRNGDRFPNDPGLITAGGKLTLLAERIFTRHKNKRTADCLNIYFAESLFKGFLWKTKNGVRRRVIIPGLNGTTLAPAILNKDGQNINVYRWKDSAGRPLGPNTPLKLEDVTGVFISRRGIGKKTVKHEIGHALGLRHLDEYNRNVPLRRPARNRIMRFGPNQGSKFSKLECEKMMTNINNFLKDY